MSESFDVSRTILKPINGEIKENGDVQGPGHRLSQSLDLKSKSPKPPLFFARSYGGREGQLLGREIGQEGPENLESSKNVPADTVGKMTKSCIQKEHFGKEPLEFN